MQNSYLVTTWLTFIGKFLKTMLISGELNCLLLTLPLPCLPPMLPFSFFIDYSMKNNALMWKSFWNLKALYSFARPRLRTLHCLAKLLNDHLPIYDTTHFFKWEFADQNFKKRALLQCQCVEHESTIWQLYFTFPYWRQDCHFTWSSSEPRKGPAICKAKAKHLFRSILWTLSVYWPDPKGRNRDTLALQSSALLTELVLLRYFRLSTSKREFSTRSLQIL